MLPLFLPYFFFGALLGFARSREQLKRFLPALFLEALFVLNSVSIRISQTKHQIATPESLNNLIGSSAVAIELVLITYFVWLSFESSFKTSSVMQLLGRSTYFFYLIHLTLAGSLANAISRYFHFGAASWVPFSSAFIVSIASSLVFCRYLEQPIASWMKLHLFGVQTTT